MAIMLSEALHFQSALSVSQLGSVYGEKKRESLQLPVAASNANTTTVPIFNGTDGADFFFGPVQEGRWEGNIENEEQSCVWVARLVGFPFFFTMDGPKLRHKKSTLKMKSNVVLVWPVWPEAGPVLAQTDPSGDTKRAL